MKEVTDSIVFAYAAADGECKEQVLPIAWLMDNPDICCEIKLCDGVALLLTHKEELLKLETEAAIDITISGDIQMLGLHVKTGGKCRVNKDMPLEVHEGIYIAAANIIIDDVIASPNFITLVTPAEPSNSVQINKDIGTKKLLISSPIINVHSLIDSEIATLLRGKINVFPKGLLMLGRPARPPAFVSPEFFTTWRNNDLKDLISRDPFSVIQAIDFVNAGEALLINTQLTSANGVTLQEGSSTEVVKARIYGKDLFVAKKAAVTGEDSQLHFENKLLVEGSCVINRLKTFANHAEVNGILFGEEALQMEVETLTKVYGVLGSKHTTLVTKLLFATAMHWDEAYIFGQYRRGGIVGEHKLDINAVGSLVVAGGYFSGAEINTRIGLDLNVLGMIYAYNFYPSTLFRFFNGLDLPCRAHNQADYINYEKLFRLTYRFAGNVAPGIRDAMSAGILATQLAQAAVSLPAAAASAVSVHYETLDRSEPADLATRSYKAKVVERIKQVYEYFAQKSVLDWINHMLAAKGMYVSGNTILFHATNTVAFANNVKLAFQQPQQALEYAIEAPSQIIGKISPLLAEVQDEAVALAKVAEEKAAARLEDLKALDLKELPSIEDVVENLAVCPEQVAEIGKSLIDRAHAVSSVGIEPNSEAKPNISEFVGVAAHAAIDAVRSVDLKETARGLVKDCKQNVDGLTAETAKLFAKEKEKEPAAEQANIAPQSTAPAESDSEPNQDKQEQIAEQQQSFKHLRSLAAEALMLVGPTRFRSGLVMLDHGLTIAASTADDAGFLVHGGITFAANSAVNCLWDFTDKGVIFSVNRYEAMRNRYCHEPVYVYHLQILADNSYEYAPFAPYEGLIYRVGNMFVMPSGSFTTPVDTRIHISKDLHARGPVLLQGEMRVDGKIIIDEHVPFDLVKAALVADELIDKGHFKAALSNVKIRKGVIAAGASMQLTDSFYAGEELSWMKASSVELIRSVLQADTLVDTGTRLKALDAFIKAEFIDHNGDWEFADFFQVETKHIQSSTTSTLTGADESFYDLLADTAKCLGAESLDSAVKYIRNMPAAEALRVALSRDEYSKQSVRTSIEVTTDDTGSVVFSGTRSDGAHTIFKTNGLITLPPEFSRARGMTFATYEEAISFVANYATWNLPPPKKKKSFWHKACKTLTGIFGAAALVCAKGQQPVAAAGLAVLCAAADKAAKHHARKRIRAAATEMQQRADLQHVADQKVLAYHHRSELAHTTRNAHVSRANHVLDNLGKRPLARAVGVQRNLGELRAELAGLHAKHTTEHEELAAAHDQFKRDIAYQAARESDYASHTGGPSVYVGVAVQAGPTGVSTGVQYGVGFNGQDGRGQTMVWDHAKPSHRATVPARVPDRGVKPSNEAEFDLDDPFHQSLTKVDETRLESADREPQTILRDPVLYRPAERIFAEPVMFADKFIIDLEKDLKINFTPEERLQILGQLSVMQDQDNYTIQAKNGEINLNGRKIVRNLHRFNAASPRFLFADGVGVLEDYSASTSIRDQIKIFSNLARILFKKFTPGALLWSLIQPRALGDGTFATWKDLERYLPDGTRVEPARLPNRTEYPALTDDGLGALPPSRAYDAARSDVVVSEFGSVPALLDRAPLVTPWYDEVADINVYKRKKDSERLHAPNPDHRYYPRPTTLPGFPGCELAKKKTDRERWRYKDKILEWDKRHGEIEMYDKRGQHIGVYNPNTGEKIKNSIHGRRIEP